MSKRTIWTNQELQADAAAAFERGLAGHRVLRAAVQTPGSMIETARDASLAEAEIVYGQPDPADVMNAPRVRFVEISSAGYTRFDREEFRDAMRRRGVVVTNTSNVFADPCAQHALAMMLGLARRLPRYAVVQSTDRRWDYVSGRFELELLTGKTVLLLGYGAIARRLADLLAPFGCRVIAVRRNPEGEGPVEIVGEAELGRVLAIADHVVNLLPANPGTRGFVNEDRLRLFKPGARFYNIGRGTTVDQQALIAALREGRVGAAYLDVTDPEPLPPDHPLWAAPNCHITPHLAGGHREQDERLVAHFLENVSRFERNEPLIDRVI